jgi:hypothetical protein
MQWVKGDADNTGVVQNREAKIFLDRNLPN